MSKENAFQAWLDETQKYGSDHREAFAAGYAAGAADPKESVLLLIKLIENACRSYGGVGTC